MDKFKVIVIGVPNFPKADASGYVAPEFVLQYFKNEEDARDVFMRSYLKDYDNESIFFSNRETLIKEYLKNGKLSCKWKVDFETNLERRIKLLERDINEVVNAKAGMCGESQDFRGIYMITEMDKQEYENPTGLYDSPYGGSTYYKFINPVTNKICDISHHPRHIDYDDSEY